MGCAIKGRAVGTERVVCSWGCPAAKCAGSQPSLSLMLPPTPTPSSPTSAPSTACRYHASSLSSPLLPPSPTYPHLHRVVINLDPGVDAPAVVQLRHALEPQQLVLAVALRMVEALHLHVHLRHGRLGAGALLDDDLRDAVAGGWMIRAQRQTGVGLLWLPVPSPAGCVAKLRTSCNHPPALASPNLKPYTPSPNPTPPTLSHPPAPAGRWPTGGSHPWCVP